MTERKVPVQSLIDHIKTAIDVDPWAKDMVEELLKEQEAKAPSIMQDVEGIWATCPTCGNKLRAILAMKMDTYFPKYCQECGQAVKWDD